MEGSSGRCSHAEIQGCVLLYLPHREECSSRLPCSLTAEGSLGHDSGMLHQPVLSSALPKAASPVSRAFEQMPSEPRIEMVQQGRPGRQLAYIQYLIPLTRCREEEHVPRFICTAPRLPCSTRAPQKNWLGEEQDSLVSTRHKCER